MYPIRCSQPACDVCMVCSKMPLPAMSLQGYPDHKKQTRKRLPLGPYSRHMPRALGGSKGGWRFLMNKVPL